MSSLAVARTPSASQVFSVETPAAVLRDPGAHRDATYRLTGREAISFPEAAARLERVLWNDPATGVMRHADAGYEDALACAREKGLDLPGILGS